jgi:hypothetical protein
MFEVRSLLTGEYSYRTDSGGQGALHRALQQLDSSGSALHEGFADALLNGGGVEPEAKVTCFLSLGGHS